MHCHELYALSKVKGVGNKTVRRVSEICHLKNIASFTDARCQDLLLQDRALAKQKGIISTFLAKDVLHKSIQEARNDLQTFREQGIETIHWDDPRYPEQLGELEDPPSFLYCRGNLDLLRLKNSIAVVGTRDNTERGGEITRRTVEYFVSKNFVIVSGLALGIDTIAHQATLACSGKTIAVIVDVAQVSPSTNRDLAKKILDSGGLLIAENSPGTSAFPALFAKRDRIQSGLSLAVFAIETTTDGGTMHAVRTSKLLRRPVYVPDPTKSGYPDSDTKQITGIQALANSGQAIAYTSATYELIAGNLEKLSQVEFKTRSLIWFDALFLIWIWPLLIPAPLNLLEKLVIGRAPWSL